MSMYTIATETKTKTVIGLCVQKITNGCKMEVIQWKTKQQPTKQKENKYNNAHKV